MEAFILPATRGIDSWQLSAESFSEHNPQRKVSPYPRSHLNITSSRKPSLKHMFSTWVEGPCCVLPWHFADYFITELCLAHKWHLAIKNYLMNTTCQNISCLLKSLLMIFLSGLYAPWRQRQYFVYTLMYSSWHTIRLINAAWILVELINILFSVDLKMNKIWTYQWGVHTLVEKRDMWIDKSWCHLLPVTKEPWTKCLALHQA